MWTKTTFSSPRWEVQVAILVDQFILCGPSSVVHLDTHQGLTIFVRPTVETAQEVGILGQLIVVDGSSELGYLHVGVADLYDLYGSIVCTGIFLGAKASVPTRDPHRWV